VTEINSQLPIPQLPIPSFELPAPKVTRDTISHDGRDEHDGRDDRKAFFELTLRAGRIAPPADTLRHGPANETMSTFWTSWPSLSYSSHATVRTCNQC
jgi:hypothetical protein